MLFVMYGTNGSIPIRDALVRNVPDANGNFQRLIDRPLFMAHFLPGKLTETQRVIAVKEFKVRNPKSPFGATPYEQDDVMGAEFATEDTMPNSPYRGVNPAFSISRFDTREDIPYEEQGAFSEEERAELKAFTERVLLEKMQHGGFMRLDDSLPKPWPNYPMEQGAGVAQKIVAAAREFGVPFSDVIEFEKTQENPRAGVISMCEAEIQKEREEAAEDAALGAVIPA
jgi:hypothetical protein